MIMLCVVSIWLMLIVCLNIYMYDDEEHINLGSINI